MLNRKETSTFKEMSKTKSESHFLNIDKYYTGINTKSETCLVPDELKKMAMQAALLKQYPKEHRFIVKLLNDLVDSIYLLKRRRNTSTSTLDKTSELSKEEKIKVIHQNTQITFSPKVDEIDISKPKPFGTHSTSSETDSLVNVLSKETFKKLVKNYNKDDKPSEINDSKSEVELININLSNRNSDIIDILRASDAEVQTDMGDNINTESRLKKEKQD